MALTGSETTSRQTPHPPVSWSDRALNIATAVVLILVAATLVRTWIRPAPGAPNPIEIGKDVNALVAVNQDQSEYDVSLVGSPKVLYLFSVRCPVCSSQKSTVDKWLRTFEAGRVLTIGSEPVELTRSYWADSSIREVLPAPLRLTAKSAKSIQATHVPYVIVTDSRGVVRLSYVGAFDGLDTAKVRQIVTANSHP